MGSIGNYKTSLEINRSKQQEQEIDKYFMRKLNNKHSEILSNIVCDSSD